MFMQYLMKALTDTWEMLWDIPAPKFKLDEDELDSRNLNRVTLLMFPVLGLITGAFLALISYIMEQLPGRYAETILFSVIAVILLEILNGARGLSYVSGALEIITRKEGFLKGIFSASTDIHSERSPVGLAVMFLFLIIRASCIGFIFSNNGPYWFMITFILGYCVQAHLAPLKSLTTNRPFLESEESMEWPLWLFTLVLVLCVNRGGLVAPLLSVIVIGALSFYLKNVLKTKAGGVTAGIIGGTGYLVETLLLIIGTSALG